MSVGDVAGFRRRCAVCAVIGCLAVGLLTGCGKKAVPAIKGTQLPVFPVSGQLAMGGEPMADAQITFYLVGDLPDGASRLRPHATTDEDGAFHVSTYGSEDGAPAGKYAVTISWKGSHVGSAGDDQSGPEKVPKEYQDPRHSPLKVEIASGANALTPWNLDGGEQQTTTSTN